MVAVQNFAAETAIIHEVPQHYAGRPSGTLALSDVSEDLSGNLQSFFERKVQGSLGRRGADVERDPATASPVPDLLVEILDDESRLVEGSQKMAEHLHGVQTGVNPAGLLCVALGSVQGVRCVAVLKVEREEGARVHARRRSGQTRLTMQYLNDLMITGRTRIFKSSVFVLDPSAEGQLEGRVADDQRGPEYSAEVASFFLASFLGCRYKADPKILTRDFFAATERFIDEQVSDPERKARYTLALLSRMHAPAVELAPAEFARHNFEAEDRRPYREFVTDLGMAPSQTFDKDTELVENRIKKVRMDFESGLLLLGPRKDVDELVDVKHNKVIVRDRVVKTRGR